jgi:hypothetical protein
MRLVHRPLTGTQAARLGTCVRQRASVIAFALKTADGVHLAQILHVTMLAWSLKRVSRTCIVSILSNQSSNSIGFASFVRNLLQTLWI